MNQKDEERRILNNQNITLAILTLIILILPLLFIM